MKKKIFLGISSLILLISSIFLIIVIINHNNKNYITVKIGNIDNTSEISLGKVKCTNTNPKNKELGIDNTQFVFEPSDINYGLKARKNKYYLFSDTTLNSVIDIFKKGNDYYKLTYNKEVTYDNSYILEPMLTNFSLDGTSDYESGYALFPGNYYSLDYTKTSWTIDFSKTIVVKNITDLINFYKDESPYYFKEDNKIYLKLYDKKDNCYEFNNKNYLVINPDGNIYFKKVTM